MSGHSKWSTIKRQKGITDQKRGQLFSKLIRAIALAARENSEPETNFKLRLLIDKAKAANMPKDNIERAIARGSGKGAEAAVLEEISYEGYGPEGIAVIAETVTDNRNRTTAEIKNIFEKSGGKLGGPGSVSFQFEKRGEIVVQKGADPDAQTLTIIDLGAEDVEEVPDSIEIYVAPEKLNEMKQKLAQAGFSLVDAELVMKPRDFIQIANSEKAGKVLKFMEGLESHDDVQRVFANFDIAPELLNV